MPPPIAPDAPQPQPVGYHPDQQPEPSEPNRITLGDGQQGPEMQINRDEFREEFQAEHRPVWFDIGDEVSDVEFYLDRVDVNVLNAVIDLVNDGDEEKFLNELNIAGEVDTVSENLKVIKENGPGRLFELLSEQALKKGNAGTFARLHDFL